MSRVCDICGKGSLVGNTVSHAHNKSKKVSRPNLQKVKALVNGRAQRVTICTRCLRSGKIQKSA